MKLLNKKGKDMRIFNQKQFDAATDEVYEQAEVWGRSYDKMLEDGEFVTLEDVREFLETVKGHGQFLEKWAKDMLAEFADLTQGDIDDED